MTNLFIINNVFPYFLFRVTLITQMPPYYRNFPFQAQRFDIDVIHA